MVRALRKGSFRQRGKSHWSWGCSAAVRVTPVSGKRQEPVLRLRAGQRPHSAHQMKGCGRAKSAHGHTLLAPAAAGTPESRSHFPSKPSWAQRCAVPSFCYQMNWRNMGALKILKSSTGDLKRCCTEAVTLPKPEIKWTKRLNNEDRIILVLQSFPTPPTTLLLLRGALLWNSGCPGDFQEEEINKNEAKSHQQHFSIWTPSAGCLNPGLAVVRGLQHGETGPSSPPSRALYYLQVVLMFWHSFYTKISPA